MHRPLACSNPLMLSDAPDTTGPSVSKQIKQIISDAPDRTGTSVTKNEYLIASKSRARGSLRARNLKKYPVGIRLQLVFADQRSSTQHPALLPNRVKKLCLPWHSALPTASRLYSHDSRLLPLPPAAVCRCNLHYSRPKLRALNRGLSKSLQSSEKKIDRV